MKKVIIDTDIGEDIDDIWALSLILSIDLFDVKKVIYLILPHKYLFLY